MVHMACTNPGVINRLSSLRVLAGGGVVRTPSSIHAITVLSRIGWWALR